MLLRVVMVLMLCSSAFLACSKDKESEPEKGAIEKMTDKTAKEIVGKIQAPIKGARSVKDQQEDRSRARKGFKRTINQTYNIFFLFCLRAIRVLINSIL